jgi:hypothetical protein
MSVQFNDLWIAIQGKMFIVNTNYPVDGHRCDNCYKSNPRVAVLFCISESNRQDFLDDPYSGRMQLFGTDCWEKIRKELGLPSGNINLQKETKS